MNKKTIDKINSACVGDTIETKKYIITVHQNEENTCNKCMFMNNGCSKIICLVIGGITTKDNVIHYFTRERKNK